LAVRLPGIIFEVFLMIRFSLVELLEWFKLSNYRMFPDLSFCHFTDDLRRFLFLPLGVIEDYRTIIGPNICPLPVQGGRVMNRKEDPQKILV